MAKIIVLVSFILLCKYEAIVITSSTQEKVLLISLDGLRWDMISTHKEHFPNIVSFVNKGVSVSHVENVFPTNTFPNHYSIVTGLYPESHGIVDNEMFDESTGEEFSMKTTDSKWWNEAEPIWVTNQKQGHNSGVVSWPGFNVRIGGLLPTYTNNSEGSIENDDLNPSREKIDLVLRWLQEPSLSFVALYYEDIDKVSHEYGEHDDIDEAWKSKKMKSIFEKIDRNLGYLKDQLEILNLENQVNVIVIGDHGHIGVANERIIRLNDYIDMKNSVRKSIGYTFVSIFPKLGQLSRLYEKLQHAHPNMTVYLKSQLPGYMHIKNNKRTAPLLLLAKPGWLIDTGGDEYYVLNVLKQSHFNRGEHGYSSLVKDMHPGFVAFGPCFKKGATFEKIRMIDVYPLMCAIMDIKPRPNNGSLDNMKMLLSEQFLTKLNTKSTSER